MKQPVISIIGTIYNQAEHAERALDIWCRQDFDLPYEIIVLDDGSTDGTRDMVLAFQRKYPELIRYYYFDEPRLIRNCTLIFNTAVRRLMRSEIAVVQWYDRIPGSLQALRRLYEPHLREDRISVSFLTRHIGGSSSRDLLEHSELTRLLESIPWREDPALLCRIMGKPGAHCHPDTMNESACFSIKKHHFEEINGYDERYFKVANYSNVELYGRLKNYGIRMLILEDHFTFHQPHTSNRDDIQTPIEPDTVILRNSDIRQNWGSILPQEMLSEDLFDVTFVCPDRATRNTLQKLCSGIDMETEWLVETEWNYALHRARGKTLAFATSTPEAFGRDELSKILSLWEHRPESGCAGLTGGDLTVSGKTASLDLKPGHVDVVMGDLFAFPRKKAIGNGLSFWEEGPNQKRMTDFSLQMVIWGGRRNYSFGAHASLIPFLGNGFLRRWGFLSKLPGCKADDSL